MNKRIIWKCLFYFKGYLMLKPQKLVKNKKLNIIKKKLKIKIIVKLYWDNYAELDFIFHFLIKSKKTKGKKKIEYFLIFFIVTKNPFNSMVFILIVSLAKATRKDCKSHESLNFFFEKVSNVKSFL